MAHPNGRYRASLRKHLHVYRSIHDAGGPTALCQALGISHPTLKRWRKAGVVRDGKAALTWAALVHPTALEPQLRLARQLVGLPPTHKLPATCLTSDVGPGTPERPTEATG